MLGSVNIDEINQRFTVIEKDWKDSSSESRTNYLAELSTMSDELSAMVGAQADSAKWLTRRINRVTRYMDSAD